MKIILASKSPRRREILENLGVKFEIITADCDEECDLSDPCEAVKDIAARKGRAVLRTLVDKENTLIIACDTLVYAGGEFLGKPEDAEDARRMLSLLSGGAHQVVSGIYLYKDGKEIGRAASTHVIFDDMSQEAIDDYIRSGEPMDKAGAYAVQGRASVYIKGIDGDYFNVVGLPVNLLAKTLKECFEIDILNI